MISLASLITNHIMDNPFMDNPFIFLVFSNQQLIYVHQFIIILYPRLIFGFVLLKILTIIEVGIVLSLFFRFFLAKTIC